MPWKGKPFGLGKPIPFLGFLPPAEDASINILRQLEEHLQSGADMDGGNATAAVSMLEPPSIDLAADLCFRSHNIEFDFQRSFKRIPKPDPRKSKGKLKLWKYGFGKKAKIVAPAPPQQFVSAIGKLAARPYHYENNWKEAGQMSAKLTLENLPSVAAVMVHPPAVQEAMPAS